MSPVPFVDLSRIHSPIKADILRRLESIIDRSGFVLGKEVEEFESQFAVCAGTSYAVGVSNGLDAITLALRALNIGPGDEVITAANTFIATVFAISAVGATPVLVDIEPDCFNLSPSAVQNAVTSRTKAIIPVHLYGQPATMAPLIKLGQEKSIAIIEDAAQAHGALYQGQPCGSMGVLGCFSFYPGKNLGSMGEGGAVTTSHRTHCEQIKMLRNVGQRLKGTHEALSGNFRLHTLQAAILLAKLPHLTEYTIKRIALAQQYNGLLGDLSPLQVPKVAPDRTHVYHLYAINTRDPKDRVGLQAHLTAKGIQTGVHYPIPVHLQPCYKSLEMGPGSFPITENHCQTTLSLPLFPGMTAQEVDEVSSAIREYFS
jgi:dTDP-4-amino-4,6-dideoxygalactose transaminase